MSASTIERFVDLLGEKAVLRYDGIKGRASSIST
jgi:hypothetical protein